MMDFQEMLHISSSAAPVSKNDKSPPPPTCSRHSIPILHYLTPINNSHLYYVILNIIFPSRNFIYMRFTKICWKIPVLIKIWWHITAYLYETLCISASISLVLLQANMFRTNVVRVKIFRFTLCIHKLPFWAIVTFWKVRRKSGKGIHMVKYICIYRGVQLKSKLQQSGTSSAAGWQPRRVYYRPPVSFHHLRLTALSFQQAKIRWFKFLLCFSFY